MVEYMDVVPEPDKDNDKALREAAESLRGLQLGLGENFSKQLNDAFKSVDITCSNAWAGAMRRATSSYRGKLIESANYLTGVFDNIRKASTLALPINQLNSIAKSLNSFNTLKSLYPNEYLSNSFYKDTGLAKQFAKMSQSISKYFREISVNWLPASEQLSEYFKAMHGPSYPSNMKEALGGQYDKDWLTTVLYDDGIPLYAVPNSRIIQRLKRSVSEVGRRSILGRELPSILKDCHSLIRPESRNTKEREISRWIEESIMVISEGHLAAGMALLSSVLELLKDRRLSDEEKSLIYPDAQTAKKLDISVNKDFEFRVKGKAVSNCVEAYGQMKTRIALFPLLSAYRKMYEKAKNNIYIEGPYSRHAVAHRPSAKLFTNANASQALLCATSLAAYVYHW